MFTNNVTVDGAGSQVQLLSEHVPETGGIQDSAWADDTISWEAAQLPRHLSQNVNCEKKRYV